MPCSSSHATCAAPRLTAENGVQRTCVQAESGWSRLRLSSRLSASCDLRQSLPLPGRQTQACQIVKHALAKCAWANRRWTCVHRSQQTQSPTVGVPRVPFVILTSSPAAGQCWGEEAWTCKFSSHSHPACFSSSCSWRRRSPARSPWLAGAGTGGTNHHRSHRRAANHVFVVLQSASTHQRGCARRRSRWQPRQTAKELGRREPASRRRR